jgi:hypothetical protein
MVAELAAELAMDADAAAGFLAAITERPNANTMRKIRVRRIEAPAKIGIRKSRNYSLTRRF